MKLWIKRLKGCVLIQAITIVMLIGCTADYAFGADQKIALFPTVSEQSAGDMFTVTVKYNVSDHNDTLTSLGVRIHFDSSKLDYTGYGGFFEFGKLADPQLQDDTGNDDNDANTDKLLLLAYSDPIGGNWPNENLPLDLVTLFFEVKADVDAGVSKINVSKVTGHAGYGFVGQGATTTLATSR